MHANVDHLTVCVSARRLASGRAATENGISDAQQSADTGRPSQTVVLDSGDRWIRVAATATSSVQSVDKQRIYPGRIDDISRQVAHCTAASKPSVIDLLRH